MIEPEHAVRVLNDVGVLVCFLCQYGVRPEFLSTHFKTKHRYTATQADVLLRYVESMLPLPCETTSDHSSVREAYSELTLFDDGLL